MAGHSGRHEYLSKAIDLIYDWCINSAPNEARLSEERISDRPPTTDRKFASRVDWNLMRTFVDIVRAGGIGAAARQLNRQQPSISAALKRFEEHVGATLLRRTATGVELTPAGQAVFELCEDMLEAARM